MSNLESQLDACPVSGCQITQPHAHRPGDPERRAIAREPELCDCGHPWKRHGYTGCHASNCNCLTSKPGLEPESHARCRLCGAKILDDTCHCGADSRRMREPTDAKDAVKSWEAMHPDKTAAYLESESKASRGT